MTEEFFLKHALIYVCMYTCVYACMYMYMYVCIIYGGYCPEGKCPTQNGSGNCPGRIVPGDLSYTPLKTYDHLIYYISMAPLSSCLLKRHYIVSRMNE